MKRGTGPTFLKKSDYSYHGTFRRYGAIIPAPIPDEFSVDANLSMPDQLADNRPQGCTGYCQSDNQSDADHTLYDAGALYERTCTLEGHDDTQGCDIRNSFKATTLYGFQKPNEDPSLALSRRGSQYFNIRDDGDIDWFDGILQAVFAQRKGASLGTPWFPSWETSTGRDGVVPFPTPLELASFKADPGSWPEWHNHAVKGVKRVQGQQCLIDKSWQGRGVGDNGWLYFSRDLTNMLLELRGSVAYIQPKSYQQNVVQIKLALLEQALEFIARMLAQVRVGRYVGRFFGLDRYRLN